MSETAPTTPDAEHAAHPHVNYFKIFLALCVCTLLSVVFDVIPASRGVVAVLVLAVAVAKAQYVMRYFMHLKFEGKWKYVLLLPTTILACGIPLALAPDIGLHYYTVTTPQARVEVPVAADHEAHQAPAKAESQPAAEPHGDH